MDNIQLEKLYVAIEAQTIQFNSEIAKVNAKIEGVNKTVEKASSGMSKAFSAVGKTLIAAFSVIAVMKFGKQLLDTADNIKTLSLQTGLSVERVQEFQYAIGQAGGSFDTVGQSIQKLSVEMDSNSDAWKKTGLSATNGADAFEKTLKLLSEMGDTTERNALGQQLLGRSFIQLKPLLNDGANSLDTLTKKARDMGLIMSSSMVNSIDQLGDTIKTLATQFSAALYPAIQAILPLLQSLANALGQVLLFAAGIIRAIFGTDTATVIDDTTGAIVEQTAAVAALKRSYSGFDELNVIQTDTGSTGGSGSGANVDASKNTNNLNSGLTDLNKTIQNGIKFWDDWGFAISAVLAIIAGALAIGTILAFSKTLGLIFSTIMDGATATSLLVNGPLVAGLGWLVNQFYLLGASIMTAFGAVEVGAGVGSIAVASLVGFAAVLAGVVAVVWAVSEAIKWGNSPVTEAVDELGYGFDKVTKKALKPFMEGMDDIEATLSRLDISNAIVSDSDVSKITLRVKSMTSIIRIELEKDKVAALNALEAIRKYYGDTPEEFAKLVEETKLYYDNLITNTEQAEAEISKILQVAADTNRVLTTEENAKLTALQQIIYDAGLVAASDNVQQLTDLRNKLSNDLLDISKNEARLMLSQSIITKNSMVADANSTYESIVLAAQGLKDAGVITTDEYKKMTDAALKAKTDTVKAANDQYQGIVDAAEKKFPDITATVDKASGKMYDNFTSSLSQLSKSWDDFWKGIEKTKVKGDITVGGGVKVDYSTYSPGSYYGANIPRYANGGMPTAGSLFMAGENGPELFGSHQGKTTVMPLENTSFVGAMKTAMVEGLTEAMAAQGSGQTILMVDGMVLAKATEKGLNKLSTVQGGLEIAF